VRSTAPKALYVASAAGLMSLVTIFKRSIHHLLIFSCSALAINGG
jgi:hypothetical protein